MFFDQPNESEAQQEDIVADYWCVYFEWRATYGISDACMDELLAALHVEASSLYIDEHQRAMLQALARMITLELNSEREVRLA